MERLGKIQKAPTQKSAMARFARKKLVILRRRGLLAMANNTIEFPGNIEHTIVISRVCYYIEYSEVGKNEMRHTAQVRAPSDCKQISFCLKSDDKSK